MDLEKQSVQALTDGYEYDVGQRAYVCLTCGEAFAEGEVFPVGGRFLMPERAVKDHVHTAHGDLLEAYFATDARYVALTDNQKTLLRLLRRGASDQEIAKELSISPATVRHQRFTFREKAKQAKLYLAMYALATQVEAHPQEQLISVHKGATMVDERYVITQEQEEQFLKSMFSSLNPLRLRHIPPRQKKKIVVLRRIAEEFEMGRRYSEQEVNEKLMVVYEDYATLRRDLIEYGFMQRTRDCKEYWMQEK